MNELLDPKQAAKLVNVQPRTLEGWRRRGCGPPFLRLSVRSVRYRLEDIERWLDQRRVADGSDLGDQSNSSSARGLTAQVLSVAARRGRHGACSVRRLAESEVGSPQPVE